MNKTEFLAALRRALGKLPSYEVEQSLAFYAEMIDDRMEDGSTEAEAVAALGTVEAIAVQIIAETPPIPKAIAKADTGSRSLNTVLLIVFSPIWVPIAFGLALSALMVYLSIWGVIVSLWAVVAVLLLCGPIGLAALAFCLSMGYPHAGFWTLGLCLSCTGLGMFAWFGVLAASKGLIGLTHRFARWLKSLFTKQRSQDGGNRGSGAAAIPGGVSGHPGAYAPAASAAALHSTDQKGAQNHVGRS